MGKIRKINDGVYYLDFINLIKGCGEFVVLDEKKSRDRMAGIKTDRSGKLVTLRHDVDRSLSKAIQMAEFEHSIGVRSTWFLLDSAEYWDCSSGFASKIKHLVLLGHRVGWHNNALAEAVRIYHVNLGSPATIDAIVVGCATRPTKWLDEVLRDTEQGGLHGSAAHGSHVLASYENSSNYCIFCESVKKLPACLAGIKQRPMAHFGLEYEAYNVYRSWYLADSGGVWCGSGINKEVGHNHLAGFDFPERMRGSIDKFKAEPYGVMQVLIHPEWWEQ